LRACILFTLRSLSTEPAHALHALHFAAVDDGVYAQRCFHWANSLLRLDPGQHSLPSILTPTRPVSALFQCTLSLTKHTLRDGCLSPAHPCLVQVGYFMLLNFFFAILNGALEQTKSSLPKITFWQNCVLFAEVRSRVLRVICPCIQLTLWPSPSPSLLL
jgi:hypothetical protein